MRRGSIIMRSGRWDWFVGDIISPTDGTVENKTLHFFDRENPNNEMMVRLDTGAEPLDPTTVEELAKDFIEARSIQDPEGTIWRVVLGRRKRHPALSIPLDYEEIPHPGKLLVFKASEVSRVRIFRSSPAKVVDFESELNLGELTNQELLKLIKA